MEEENKVEEISIRRLAAFCISKNDEEGLRIIDEIIEKAHKSIKWKIYLFMTVFSESLFVILLFFMLFISNLTTNRTYSGISALFVLLSAFCTAISLCCWRRFQYGSFFKSQKIQAIYAGEDDNSISNLERFFDALGKESARTYYYKENGKQKTVTKRCFWGSLRLLLLADERSKRSLVFLPLGFSFDHELFVETNVAQWIKEAKATPHKPRGRKELYDYEAILLDLIETPFIAKIDPDKRGSKTRLCEHIASMWDGQPGLNNRVPERTRLMEFSKKFLDHIKKNRALKR